MNHKCKNCEKTVNKGELSTIIISGSMGDMALEDFRGSFVFHDDCFLEIAGKYHCPAFGAETVTEST